MSSPGFGDASRIVVVGAALAGIRACEQLRTEGYSGRIVLVGAEAHAPYDRPPLTKRFLAGTVGQDELALGPRAGIASLDLDLRLATRATGLDLEGRVVVLDRGGSIGFDGLVVATGARARTLSHEAPGILTLRTLDEAAALRARLKEGSRLVVIGGGFLGLEAAATARGLGASVVVVEAGPEPLERVVGRDVGAAIASYHRARGIDIRTGVGVAAVGGREHPSEIELADGEVLACEEALVAIGVVAETDWLEGSGLVLDDGLVTDETLAAAPGVVGAGDVVRAPSSRAGGLVRHEHWTSAAEQAVHAARRLLDLDPGPFDPIPYFWSDQFDLKILGLGNPSGALRMEVTAGSLDSGRFLCCYERDGRLVGAVCSNMARQLMKLRPEIEAASDFATVVAAQNDSADRAGTT